jgi:hypothetical protein
MSIYHSFKALRWESWDHDEDYLPNATASTMERYLLEQDRPLFTSMLSGNADPTINAFPGDPYDTGKCTNHGLQDSYCHPRRLSSPTNSGLESSGVSSGWSDRQGTPRSSPEVNHLAFVVAHGAAFEDYPCLDQNDVHYGGACVAMNDVQMYADHQADTVAFDDDPVTGYSQYGTFAQEGYEPLLDASDEQVLESEYNIPSMAFPPQAERLRQASPGDESDAPVVRRRRPQASRAVTAPSRTSKVTKRCQPGRRSSQQACNRSEASSDARPIASSKTAFPCPLQEYGCQSTFGSKNEWKRHVTTQHMRLGFWRCEWCSDRKPNDFNRKDLFVQHVRRMHPNEMIPARGASNNKKSGRDTSDEQASNAAAIRCYRHLRSPPEKSCCLLCDVHFRGPGSWEERMEHLGHHLEGAKKGTEVIDSHDWRSDSNAHAWMVKEEIVVSRGEGWVLAERL